MRLSQKWTTSFYYTHMSIQKVIFKTYNQNQAVLFPPDLDELVEKNHPVRVINRVIDNLDIDALLKKYKEKWLHIFLSSAYVAQSAGTCLYLQ